MTPGVERSNSRRRIVFVAVAAAIALGSTALALIALPPEVANDANVVANFSFQNAEGEPVQLTDFRGKAVLLNIWATWCVPCREEMPTLDNLQAELGGPDFEVVALSIDVGGLAAVEAFYAEIGIANLAIYLDPPSASWPALGIVGIPTTVLLDHDGRELMRVVGPAEWDSEEMIATIRGHLDAQPARQRHAARRRSGAKSDATLITPLNPSYSRATDESKNWSGRRDADHRHTRRPHNRARPGQSTRDAGGRYAGDD